MARRRRGFISYPALQLVQAVGVASGVGGASAVGRGTARAAGVAQGSGTSIAIADSGEQTGVCTQISTGISLSNGGGDNFGVKDIVTDPIFPNIMYACTCYDGIWWSQDYGLTWSKRSTQGGPLDSGKNWCMAIAQDGSYMLVGAGNNFTAPFGIHTVWKSVNGAVTWTAAADMDAEPYQIEIDPDDVTHVIASAHENGNLYESFDSGASWVARTGTGASQSAYCHFITPTIVLMVSDGDAGAGQGTRRGVWNGSAWVWSLVSDQQHYHGYHQMVIDRYQNPPILWNGGAKGIDRSTDYGATWTRVTTGDSSTMWASDTRLWSGRTYPIGGTGGLSPNFRTASRSAGTPWDGPTNPSGMVNGPKRVAVSWNGSHYVFVSGNHRAGIWRYVEPAFSNKSLTVVGRNFQNLSGQTVVLRGLSSMGMGMVYGDRSNPGTYVAMSSTEYVDRARQIDTTGNRWYSNAIRLIFERFPCTNPARLYTVEYQPWAMGDTITFPAWAASTVYNEGSIVASGGTRFVAAKRLWRGDKGQGWNLPVYQVGDRVVNTENRVYQCISSTGSGTPDGNWGNQPLGTGSSIPEDQGPIDYVWQFVGNYGQAGTTAPHLLTPSGNAFEGTFYFDNLVMWRFMSTDYTAPQMEANFLEFQSKVMAPVIQRAIDLGMYVVVCEFDFGPAHHPLRAARMLDLWPRLASWSLLKNHPQVIFELWNESEDIGTVAGGPGSWSAQKATIQSVVNAIRAQGATNPIIVPPPFFSAWVGEATASPLTGSNLAYALHQYRSQWEAFSSNRDQIIAGLASGLPIVMTEWGCEEGGEGVAPALQWPLSTTVPPALRALLEAAEGATNPAAGHFAWALGFNWAPNLFTDNTLTTPTNFGISARQWLDAYKP